LLLPNPKSLTSRNTSNPDFLVVSPLKLSSLPVAGKLLLLVLFFKKELAKSLLITVMPRSLPFLSS
jgi:hypothetical protein